MHLSYVDIGSVHPIHGITSTAEMAFENAPSRARRIVRDGDDDHIHRGGHTSEPSQQSEDPVPNTIVSTGFAVVRPRSISPSFMSYVLSEQGFIEAIMARSVGVKLPCHKTHPKLECCRSHSLPSPNNAPSPLSSTARQRRSTCWVAKKRTLIKRLKEERTALITRYRHPRSPHPRPPALLALSRIPSSNPLASNGLGEVPTHWDICTHLPYC